MRYTQSFDSFLFEAKKKAKAEKIPHDNDRTVLLLDGTGSAGKSHTLREIGAKKPIKGETVGDKDYEVIALDDFFPISDDPEALKDPKEPANQARWRLEKQAGVPDEVIEWSKKTGQMGCDARGWRKMHEDANKERNAALEKIKGMKNPTKEKLYDVCKPWIDDDIELKKKLNKMNADEYKKELIKNHEGKIKENQKVVDETPNYSHPDMPEGEYPGRWYMAQQYKNSKSKKIVFDDVEPGITKFLPKGTVKPILLHSDPAKLERNIKSREKTEPRDPTGVFDDYLSKYEFTKEKPKEGEGDPGKPVTRAQMEKTLKSLTPEAGFSLSRVDDDYAKNWLKKSGMTDDGTYYMRLKKDYVDQYGNEKPVLVNSKEDGSHLKEFKKITSDEEERVQSGEKKVELTVKKGSEKEEEKAKEEIKKIDDAGSSKMFASIPEKIAKQIKDSEVTIPMPGGKKKSIQIETLMDFVPISLSDPEEQAMIKMQQLQYAKINNLRLEKGLKPLIDFDQWLERNIQLAKDNKEYQQRIKDKTLRSMKSKAVKENKHILTFESFLNEANFA